MNGTLVKKQVTITYPQEFVKVTPAQTKKLQAALKSANPASQAAQKQALDMAVHAPASSAPAGNGSTKAGHCSASATPGNSKNDQTSP
jgi:hypothetical protein